MIMIECGALLAKSIAVGFLISAPVGPIAFLCIHRTLKGLTFQAFAGALGAATADTVFALSAGAGLASLSHYLQTYAPLLRYGGAFIILYLGIALFFKKQRGNQGSSPRTSLAASFGSAFVVTITNPITIAAFAGVFTAFGIASFRSTYSMGIIAGGVLMGSLLWWTLLILLARFCRHYAQDRHLTRLSKGIGLLLIATAIGLVIFPYG